ncbi:5-carboxymethyl-2-hydroxymuconate isomerase [Paenibacillus sp. VTT E-133280]|jgi:2-keto-4-pentenoate hydratase/2-oxohepta-3-ene-1,7-dioic acid hydratase in catechol pathway|uniref:fumarylacetoacetate hydrolase family protein n=1 Tax=Paenibacillus sp. VTT E-133280 TaxID=1986222 RepID=UPI000BA068CE|nr:fumarylacetoacetate hydrolase family protein [Paenibacillus sp. VTT E-133280]OZQ61911.1 5-carboxymethyl-2-hydroxymuconate isomerase [Paenibacillus sp. VTT E-133280]
MKLMTFLQKENDHMGVLTARGVVDIEAAQAALSIRAEVPVTVRQLLDGGEDAFHQLRTFVDELPIREGNPSWLKQEEELTFGPCVTDPGKIICIGLNYRRHAEETGMAIPEFPILFNKFNNTLTGHGSEVPLPKTSHKVDYEAELGIVIGRTAKYVAEEEALDYVLGYCTANDLSARDLQMRTSQWLAGKSCDKFSPIGPYLVTTDEVGDPNQLDIQCTVNGELRQNSNTSDMIFNCKQIVSYVSQCMTLSPGDIILTGTPEGVVMGYAPENQFYLQDGDVVTVQIEKLGAITNTMVSE